MKRWSLLIATAATVLTTGLVLHSCGRFGRRAHPGVRPAPRHTLPSAVALRQAQCQPLHWRDCMLAR
jgi:hypothetical protein